MLPLISGLEFTVAHQLNDKGPIPLQEDYKSSSLLTTYELKSKRTRPFQKDPWQDSLQQAGFQNLCTVLYALILHKTMYCSGLHCFKIT